jgi:thiol-disulfide isomerase/thioredoxin
VSQDLSTPASVADFLQEHPICALYFTTPDCGICKVLKPKLLQMLTGRFPAIRFGQVDCSAAPALAADLGVFAVPTLIGGDAVLGAAERAANLGVDTIKLAATYGRDGLRVLDKLGAVRFAKFSARAAKIGWKGDFIRLKARLLTSLPTWLLSLFIALGGGVWVPWRRISTLWKTPIGQVQ